MTQLVPTRQPRDHQRKALEKSHNKRAFFVQMEMGTGKSKVAIDEALQFYLDNIIDRVLIVAGKGSYADWIDKHLPENVPDYIPIVSHLWKGGGSVAEQKQLGAFINSPPMLRILVMNIESIGRSTKAQTVARNFVTGGRTMTICDESSKIKNISALQTQEMVRLGKSSKILRALTGSAVTRSPTDLWGQMAFLGLEKVLGQNYFLFERRYCIQKKINVHIPGSQNTRKATMTVGYRDLDKLEEVVRPYSFRVLKEDCLDLPPKIYQQMSVDLTEEQQKIYNDYKRISMTALKSGEISSTSHALTRILRLHQILCGHIVDDDGVIHHVKTNRLQALEDVIEETTGKVAIWCSYRFDVVAVENHLQKIFPNEEIVTYFGETRYDERREAVEKFQNGTAKFWVGTAATGGYVITLTSCRTVVYYSNSYNLEHRIQSEDRFHRDGQTQSVTYVDLITPKTVDELIIKCLKEKKVISQVIAGDGFRSWIT